MLYVNKKNTPISAYFPELEADRVITGLNLSLLL